MTVNRTLCLAIVATGLLCAPSLAQTPATPPANHTPLAKTIGEAGSQIVPSLIVINSSKSQASESCQTVCRPRSTTSGTRCIVRCCTGD